nr:MAG TPA_asm: hypothetical protein [Caudoviricetes sp.]
MQTKNYLSKINLSGLGKWNKTNRSVTLASLHPKNKIQPFLKPLFCTRDAPLCHFRQGGGYA